MDTKSRKTRMDSVTECGNGRINDLQDEILCHILSYLPTEDRVRACFVSKRWESLWSPLSVIDLDYDRFCKTYNGSNREDKDKRFTAFVEHAMSKTWESLTVMKLERFELDPLKYGVFKSLRTIVLNDVTLPAASIHELMEQCPILEELHLIECYIPDNSEFYFDAPETLKCLVMDFGGGFEEEFRSVHISAPSVKMFKFTGDLIENFDVGSLPNLVEAEILLFGGAYSLDSCLMMHDLIGCFCEAQTLTLSSSFFELLSTFAYEPSELEESVEPPFLNLKNLTLHSSLGDFELVGLHRFLRSCPNIETLTIDRTSGGDYKEKFWEKQSVPFDFLHHLKKLEMKSFDGRNTEMEFMNYMLANALVLKKMVIYKAEWQDPCISSIPDENHKRSFQEHQEKSFEKVLSFKRASPDVEILLQ